MSGFFQNLLKDTAEGFFGNDYLRDYTHASKTFIPNAYQYAPKFKFLFHVYFEINPSVYSLGASSDPNLDANFGLAVKTVKIPSYSFDTHVMNQYNRKRIVQTKIKYDPIDIVFHDDNGGSASSPTGGGIIRNLWYNYYTYYYQDATKPVNSSNYNTRNTYAKSITGNTDWGYIGETSDRVNGYTQTSTGQTKIPFFKNITIYGFNQRNYVAYTLINPMITRFAHDTYDYSQGNGTMENSMSIDYETVKYFKGAMNGKNPSNKVPGFGLDQHFDLTVSPIARPGSQATILGQGGLVDGGEGILNDLTPDADGNRNILGAIQKAGVTYNTLKNMNLKQTAKAEITKGITNAIMNPLNNTGRNKIFNILSFGSTPNPPNSSFTGVTPPDISAG